MPYYRKYNSPEARRKRSERATSAVNARWDRYHADVSQQIPDPLPVDLFRLTFENLITGKTEVLLFHPGDRTNNYRIDVNGKYWRTCGFADAMERVGKGCYKSRMNTQEAKRTVPKRCPHDNLTDGECLLLTEYLQGVRTLDSKPEQEMQE